MTFVKQLHNFHISAITFLAFITIVFLITDFSVGEMVGDIFGKVYDYADDESRSQAHSFITDICASEIGASGALDFAYSDFCDDPNKRSQLRKKCSTLKDTEAEIAPSITNCMKVPRGEMKFCDDVMEKYDEIHKLEEPCGLVESGELEILCKDRQVDLYLKGSNQKKLYSACSDINRGNIDRREELSKMVQTIMPNLNNTGLNPLQNLAVTMSEKRDTIIVSSIVLLIILIIALFIAYMPYFLEFAYHFSKIIIRVGVLLAIPPLLLSAYLFFVPINTSWILLSLENGLPQDSMATAAKELFPLALQTMIPLTLLYIGIILVSFGTFGWFFFKNIKKVELSKGSEES